MSEQPTPKRRKWLIWLAVIILGLPILFYLFEFVVPKFLPSNF